ncbi:hypothetical protein GCM10025780_32980 [Frondihabitans cladoniiphilus]|uniref:Uncharacterized protein n=1 Tax=Frondihabitans cladoniiphilus TaxID=715785 RepID=A0ABP8W8S2_9MICO
MRAVGLRPDPRVQARSKDVDDHLGVADGDGLVDDLVARGGIERGDECGVHEDSRGKWLVIRITVVRNTNHYN